MQCNMTQSHNSNGTLRHNDIRTKAQLQQDKGTVDKTNSKTENELVFSSIGCPNYCNLVPWALLTMQTRSPVTNDAIKTFAQETMSPKRNIFSVMQALIRSAILDSKQGWEEQKHATGAKNPLIYIARVFEITQRKITYLFNNFKASEVRQ